MARNSMRPTEQLSPRQLFFFDHAGYSYDPATETPEHGRTRCAIQLAEAEALYLRAHQLADVVCIWQDDPIARQDGTDAECVEVCLLMIGDSVAASLGAIEDATEEYRQVVRAELAMECAEQLRLTIEEEHETGGPNLDGMPADDLLSFWQKHQGGRNYRELFPKGGKGTRRATADLANYASNKATAMSCRVRGDISAALMYEGIADRIYKSLPNFARW